MPVEIERKFLVSGEGWRRGAVGIAVRQGFLALEPERTVRVRIADDRAFLTVKGRSEGASRLEFEYAIPVADARVLLERLCRKPLIEKTRFRVEHDDLVWEIDEFHGENEGLVIAEVELEREDQVFRKPSWVGEEVTGDPRYYNVNLVSEPYSRW